jgi:hypothetical protein
VPVTLLHFAAGTCGVAFVFISLFLYETQEGRLQNRLEELWVRVDDLSKTAMTKEQAVIQQTSQMLSKALDGLFGKKLLSLKSVATSFGLSTTSISIFILMLEPNWWSLTISVISFSLSVAPGKLRYGTFIFVLGVYYIGLNLTWSFAGSFAVTMGAYAGGLLSDLFVIILLRWLLSRSSEFDNTSMHSIWKLIGFVILESALGFVVVAPLLVIRLAAKGHVSESQLSTLGYEIALGIGSSNLFTALVCLLIVLLLIVVLMHRAIWPLFARPIYAVQKFGLVRHPKLLAGLGATCFMIAWPKSPLVVTIDKLLHLSG